MFKLLVLIAMIFASFIGMVITTKGRHGLLEYIILTVITVSLANSLLKAMDILEYMLFGI